MKLINYLVASSIVNVIIVILFIGVTKNLPQFNSNANSVASNAINDQANNQTSQQEQRTEETKTGTQSTGQTNPTQQKAQPQPTSSPNVLATQQPVASPTPQPQQQKPQCLVRIDGATYDLQEFRSIHGGGDVFQCNTDMTSIFYSQHQASYLNVIAKYRIQ